MRRCGFCDVELVWIEGEERTAREQAGVRWRGEDKWRDLERDRWPR